VSNTLDEVDYNALLEAYCVKRDIATRNLLIEHYSYIAQIAAKKFVGRGVEYDDLLQVASLALIKALERFDCSKGVQFGSFATPSIIGEIKNYFRDKTRAVRIPRRDNELMKKLELSKSELLNKLGRYPRPNEIAEHMGITIERVYELEETRTATQMISLDSFGSETDDDINLLGLLGSEEKEYANIENQDFFKKCIQHLDARETKLIMDRFVKNMSQSKIAEGMGVSQMYVSRMERAIIKKLQKIL